MSRTPWQTGVALLGATTVTAALIGLGTTAQAEGQVLGDPTQAVDGSYIVVLKDGESATAHSTRAGVTVTSTYSTVLNGYAARMTEERAKRLAADPAVAFVQRNQILHATDTQQNPVWGLDRVDQRDLPLDQSYSYPTGGGNGVTAYVVDTGVRVTHQEFGGRAKSGKDFVDNDDDANDGYGHGTHVAGTIGGTTFGIAKGVAIVAVRVLNDQGSGTTEQVTKGIDWAAGDAQGKKAVGNMSLGGPTDPALDTATGNAVKAGLTFVVAAGNSDKDAKDFSPAHVAEAITVGATDKNDQRATFSNHGAVLDVFAPGVDITSAFNDSDTGTKNLQGTSMAAPHVAGVAALILAAGTATTPADVEKTIKDTASKDKVKDPKESPNNLLYFGS